MMKKLALTVVAASTLLAFSPAQAKPFQTASQDMKNAGHDTAAAGKKVGHTTARDTKTGYHKTTHATKTGYHKTAHATKSGYHKTVNGTHHTVNKVDGHQ